VSVAIEDLFDSSLVTDGALAKLSIVTGIIRFADLSFPQQ